MQTATLNAQSHLLSFVNIAVAISALAGGGAKNGFAPRPELGGVCDFFRRFLGVFGCQSIENTAKTNVLEGFLVYMFELASGIRRGRALVPTKTANHDFEKKRKGRQAKIPLSRQKASRTCPTKE